MSYLKIEDWSDSDCVDVIKALRKYEAHLKDTQHPYSSLIDGDYAIATVLSGRMPAVIIGDYLLLYLIHEVWFSPIPVLSEVLLTKLPGKEPVGLGRVIEVMAEIASANKCAASVVGNGSLRKGLTRKYEGSGYRLSNLELIKELNG